MIHGSLSFNLLRKKTNKQTNETQWDFAHYTLNTPVEIFTLNFVPEENHLRKIHSIYMPNQSDSLFKEFRRQDGRVV